MNGIAKLIQSKTIPFAEMLMRYYHLLGLDETNAIIILKLYFLSNNNDFIINTDSLCESMTINKNELEKRIISLIEAGYITLTLTNNKEEFNLDAVFEKIGEIIEQSSNEPVDNKKERIGQIVEYVESTYGRLCTSTDLITINNWVKDDISFEDIKKAVFESFKASKMQLRYADAILLNNLNNKKREENIKPNELNKLLNSAYVKRR